MKFLLYFIAWHDGASHHGNIVIDTPPSRENIDSLREAIAKVVLTNSGSEIDDPDKHVTICNLIPLPDKIIRRGDAPHIFVPTENGNGN